MSRYILYCRAGFEKDCANEIQHHATEAGLFGFCRAKDNFGYVEFELTNGEDSALFKKVKLDKLVFTRQWFCLIEELFDLDPSDRISPIVKALAGHEYADITLDYADTNEGKAVSSFTKKFVVPLQKALNKQKVVQNKAEAVLHIFLFNSQHILLGFSPCNNRSDLHLGIRRLKFPASAPSRSTLKLEEAFHYFIAKSDWPTKLSGGLNAVDLGAAPGGWTYQLVQRGMMVSAIDNGPMNKDLMETGQVKHLREDGFKYEPKKRNVHWLVCDMVEKPTRVAALMVKWIVNDWCKEAIFNLKLPMKQRYQHLAQVVEQMEVALYEGGVRYKLQIKHLYHDREEVTCYLTRI
ncbi:23S rRNA C2498 ribose 2'-O-ribose methyltransferase [Catenovulum agarivorans DS-2]|uniref:Ribosomal RNA large subunit methyltransferase M n=1 Tax=Catenovulum agarivorans DS-2 TaxID=1328313 RepID=W7QPU4_9ALTE|nr:23S rRNA (cytidine(2498)-2'-O)-methyltransferase RlmM [Catenovulum agarivorans]EWH11007.1 23S rRNA C2498 ribose 2'-O-ribose methyltransferase [Catenovulum agarivorans DS-2]